MNFEGHGERHATARPLERGRGLAAWRQIADAIAAEIRGGGFAPGEQLPTEAQFAVRFGVNRHTARRAIGVLAAEGLVRAAQGRGTFVEAQPLPYPVGPRTRFTENVALTGHEPGGEVLSAIDVPASEDIAGRLGVAPGTLVVEARIRRLSDGVPIAIGMSRLPLPRFAAFAAALRRKGSVTDGLKACGVHDYRRLTTAISARVATEEEAALLELAPGRVVLAVEGLNVDAAGVPVQTVDGVFAADRVRLTVAD